MTSECEAIVSRGNALVRLLDAGCKRRERVGGLMRGQSGCLKTLQKLLVNV